MTVGGRGINILFAVGPKLMLLYMQLRMSSGGAVGGRLFGGPPRAAKSLATPLSRLPPISHSKLSQLVSREQLVSLFLLINSLQATLPTEP